MAVSMAVIPTLKGKAASSVLETLSTSKIKPYSQEAKVDTEKMLGEILQKREPNDEQAIGFYTSIGFEKARY